MFCVVFRSRYDRRIIWMLLSLATDSLSLLVGLKWLNYAICCTFSNSKGNASSDKQKICPPQEQISSQGLLIQRTIAMISIKGPLVASDFSVDSCCVCEMSTVLSSSTLYIVYTQLFVFCNVAQKRSYTEPYELVGRGVLQ